MNNQKKVSQHNDEYYTPDYAVKPILEYLKPNSVIWCPFDKEQSAYVKVLINAGHNVIFTHIETGQDFLTYEPNFEYDYIISNPPYSIMTTIIKKLNEINKPFAMLIGLQSLTIIHTMNEIMKINNLSYLMFNRKPLFFNAHKNNYSYIDAFYLSNCLPEKLILKELIREKKV